MAASWPMSTMPAMQDATQPVVDLVYFNAGGGHRNAALALEEAITAQGRPWAVRRINLVEVLDRGQAFRRLTGLAPEDLYNLRLARGWTMGMRQELKLLQAVIRLSHGPLRRLLTEHWAATEPDLVVSLIPNFNRALAESVQLALPGVPFVTVMTDLADLPPHFWCEPGQAQHLVCGTAHAVAQAIAAGHPADRLSLVSGMMLRQVFHRSQPLDRRAARVARGLDPDRPTAAVMYGGRGSGQMVALAEALPDLQMVLLCGHNAALAARLERLRRPAPQVVLGFTDDVAGALRLGDFFIGKPGPGSLSEALHLGLPVLTFENTWTLPQERYNARWVRDKGLGVVVRGLREVPAAAAELLGRLPRLRQRVAGIRNRAVFDVVDLLDLQMRRSTMPLPPTASVPA